MQHHQIDGAVFEKCLQILGGPAIGLVTLRVPRDIRKELIRTRENARTALPIPQRDPGYYGAFRIGRRGFDALRSPVPCWSEPFRTKSATA